MIDPEVEPSIIMFEAVSSPPGDEPIVKSYSSPPSFLKYNLLSVPFTYKEPVPSYGVGIAEADAIGIKIGE